MSSGRTTWAFSASIGLVVLATIASAQDALTPPRVLSAPAPAYPESELDRGVDRDVVLHVTISAEGALEDVHVDRSAGEPFDSIATTVVRTWRFAPARRGDTPIASSVRVEVPFRVPRSDLTTPDDHDGGRVGDVDADAGVAEVDAGVPEVGDAAVVDAVFGDAAPRDSAVMDGSDGGVSGQSELRPHQENHATEAPPADDEFHATAHVNANEVEREPRGTSDFVLERDVLEAAPHEDAASMLRSAPGVFVARGEGEAVAHSITLRGFDAEHGQDIELRVGGVPVNQPSHIHGQGYADLGFVLPEIVRAVRVTEGVYDPEQGDFAVAGTVDFDLGVTRRGITSRSTYGSFGTFRQLVLFAPDEERDETFGAVAYRRTSGYGQNRAGESGTAFAQYAFGGGDSLGRVSASFYGARAALAGVVRRDDLDAGRIGFYDVYDLPTTRAQSASALRGQLAASYEARSDEGAVSEIAGYVVLSDFRLQGNYTGFLQRSRAMPEWSGRGDLVEQGNETLTFGAKARHRTRIYELTEDIHGSLEAGLSARLDLTDQAQNLVEAPQNQTWDEQVDASITGADIGMHADLDAHFTEHVRLRGGVRADVLHYDIDDRLGNFIPRFRRDSYIVGYRRSAMGIAAGPRASLEITPIESLAFVAAYGEGYRSPQARLLDDGEDAPYTKVRSGDVGVRFTPGDVLSLTLTGYLTSLSDDIAFDPQEGRLERLGPTTRLGAAMAGTVRPADWFLASASVTFVHATLDEPPPASAEDPAPPFRSGQLLPYVPPWVARLDTSVNHALFEIDGHGVTGKVGLGLSFLSERPLPYATFTRAFALLDASASLSWRALELTVEATNLLDTEYAATAYSAASSFDPDAIPSRLAVEHVAAGPPLMILATLGVSL